MQQPVIIRVPKSQQIGGLADLRVGDRLAYTSVNGAMCPADVVAVGVSTVTVRIYARFIIPSLTAGELSHVDATGTATIAIPLSSTRAAAALSCYDTRPNGTF